MSPVFYLILLQETIQIGYTDEIEDGINNFLIQKAVTDPDEEKKIRRFLEQLVNAYKKEIS